MIKLFRSALFALTGLLALQATADATPLTLNYTVQPYIPGYYLYDFSVVLDNHDGTWASGQQWDQIIFGDASYTESPFFLDWHYVSYDPIIFPASSGGSHNGPTLLINPTLEPYSPGVLFGSLPGWEPTAVGDTLQWSGFSSKLLGQGDLLWSTLVASNVSQRALFDVAQLNPTPVPPALPLFASGLGVLGLAGWRRRRQKSVS